MLNNIRRALMIAFAASLGLAGLSYAATGNLNPVKNVSDNQVVTPPTDDTADEAAEGTEEAESEAAHAADGAERSTEGCGDGTFENHGQFVSSQADTPRNEAAKSPCGKPVQSVHADDEGDDTGEETGEVTGSEGPENKNGEHGKSADHKPADEEPETEGS